MAKSMDRILIISGLLVCGVITSQSGLAAELDTIPAVDPGQIQRTIAKEAAEKFPKPVLAAPALPEPKQAAKVKEQPGIDFHLTKIVIQGAAVYKANDLLPLYQAYLGKDINLAQLQKIVDAITAKYRNDGYILSRAFIPPQRIKGGEVTIRVVEGYVDQATVQGEAGKASSLIQSYTDQIIQVRPLQITTLERYALLTNDIPGIKAKSLLRPSPITPGASDLTMEITEYSPYNVFASFDNRGTPFVGPNQFFAGGYLNSMARPGDRIGLTMARTSQAQELQFYQLSYLTPIQTNGATIEISAQNSNNAPGYLLQRLDIQGRSQEISVKFNYPFLRSRKHNLSFATAFTQRNTFTDALQRKLYRDRIRSIQFDVNYNGYDNWKGANNLGFTVEQGLNILGASSAGQTDITRPKAIPNYTKFNLTLGRVQYLPRNFSTFVSATGQYSLNPLYASEQFGFGGSQFGRAYDPYEISGDQGLAGKVELRYDQVFNQRFLQAIQYYAYYDIGAVWNIDTASQAARLSAAASGLGARFALNKQTQASLEIAKPLTRPVASQSPHGHGMRVFFNLVWFK